MPAPNIATLYDFESAYEDALANYFANMNVGGQTFRQVITPRSNLTVAELLVTPRLQVRVSMIGLGADGSGVKEDTVSSNGVTTNYYSHYQLGISLGVVTARENVSQLHGLLRGGVRQGMLEYSAILNANTVPYFQTVFMNPGGSMQAIDGENDEIITELSWQADMFIPPSSWPA